MLQEEHDVYIPLYTIYASITYVSSASVDVVDDEPVTYSPQNSPLEQDAFQPPHYPPDPHDAPPQPRKPFGRAGAILLLTLVLALIFGVGLFAGWEFTSSSRSSTATTSKSVSTTSITTSGTTIETQQDRALIGSLALVVLLAGCTSSGAKQGAGASSGRPTTATATGGSTSPASGTPSSTPSDNPPRARVAPRLSGFRITDLTSVSTQGWALGSAQCLSSTGRCDAIEHTTDGGRTWASLAAPAAGPGDSPTACARLCVAGLRFATTSIGYAFAGPGLGGGAAFFRTQDGGRTWHRQSGGRRLESLNGNIVRVVAATPGCRPAATTPCRPPPCRPPPCRPPPCRPPPSRARAGGRSRSRAGPVGACDARPGRAPRLPRHLRNPAPEPERLLGALHVRRRRCPRTNAVSPARSGAGRTTAASCRRPTGAAAIICLIRGATATPSLITSADGGQLAAPVGRRPRVGRGLRGGRGRRGHGGGQQR